MKSFFPWTFSAIFITALSLPITGWSASCCGGGAAFPTLITGDFRSQASFSTSYGSLVGTADDEGAVTFRRASNLESTSTNTVEGGYQLSDRFQLGLTVPYISKYRSTSQASEGASGLGDVSAVGAYEILPVYTYSEWKPRGFLYQKTTLPTAPSIYESTSNFATEARGGGFYTFAVGMLFMKTRGNWDFAADLEVAQSLARVFESNVGRVRVNPGPRVSGFLSAGYSPSQFSNARFGVSLAPHLNAAKETTGAVDSMSHRELYWDSVLSLNYLVDTELMVGASYLDQTLIGPVTSTSLSRSVSLIVQKRWSL